MDKSLFWQVPLCLGFGIIIGFVPTTFIGGQQNRQEIAAAIEALKVQVDACHKAKGAAEESLKNLEIRHRAEDIANKVRPDREDRKQKLNNLNHAISVASEDHLDAEERLSLGENIAISPFDHADKLRLLDILKRVHLRSDSFLDERVRLSTDEDDLPKGMTLEDATFVKSLNGVSRKLRRLSSAGSNLEQGSERVIADNARRLKAADHNKKVEAAVESIRNGE